MAKKMCAGIPTFPSVIPAPPSGVSTTPSQPILEASIREMRSGRVSAAPTQSFGIFTSKLVAPPAHGFETTDGPRSAIMNATSRSLRPKRTYGQTHRLITSMGNRWRGRGAEKSSDYCSTATLTRQCRRGCLAADQTVAPTRNPSSGRPGTALRSWSRVRTVYASDVRIVAGSEIGINPMISRKHRGY